LAGAKNLKKLLKLLWLCHGSFLHILSFLSKNSIKQIKENKRAGC